MITDLAILTICGLAITLLGLIIFVRNPSQPNNLRFASLSLSLVGWTIFNYLSDNASSHNLLYTRLTFFFGVAAIFTVLNFIANFPSETVFRKNILLRFHRILTFLIAPLVFLPSFISGVGASAEDGYINTSYLYNFFILYVAYSLLLLFYIIARQNHFAKSSAQKQQAIFVSWGIVLYAILAISSNVILPMIIDDWSVSRYGPAFTLFFVGVVAVPAIMLYLMQK